MKQNFEPIKKNKKFKLDDDFKEKKGKKKEKSRKSLKEQFDYNFD